MTIDGKPALDEIRIHYYDDTNTQLLAFKNNDIDFCDLPSSVSAVFKRC